MTGPVRKRFSLLLATILVVTLSLLTAIPPETASANSVMVLEDVPSDAAPDSSLLEVFPSAGTEPQAEETPKESSPAPQEALPPEAAPKQSQSALEALTLISLAPAVPAEAKLAGSNRFFYDSIPGFAEPLVYTRKPSNTEDEELAKTLKSYAQMAKQGDIIASLGVIEAYLKRYPESSWRMALQTNMGLAYYQAGRFSKAIDAFADAWQAGRNAKNIESKALTDKAVGELIRMYARLGRADDIEKLLKDVGDRPITGAATEAFTGAREGLWMMRNDWGKAYLCGPAALRNMLLAQEPRNYKRVSFIDAVKSGKNGVSLAEVGALAAKAGIPYRLAYREDQNSEIPVPSVVHWKLNHYAAIVERGADGLYHIEDPTFGEGLWVTGAAINDETSGFFLLPAKDLPPGYRKTTEQEAKNTYGRGFTIAVNPFQTGVTGLKAYLGRQLTSLLLDSCGLCENTGAMPRVDIVQPSVSVTLLDTPIGYKPPLGPPVFNTLIYNQREASQPANFTYFNVGQKWSLGWQAYILHNDSLPGRNVVLYTPGGSQYSYPGTSGGIIRYNTTTGEFLAEETTGAVLKRVPASGPATRFERIFPDGSKEIYGYTFYAVHTVGNKVMLTQLVDPEGNTVNLAYDAQVRLTTATDALGRVTTYSYTHPTQPLLITGITDPFGRTATLGYDASFRLNSITDVGGLTSTFTYDGSGLVNSITTPYGTSTLTYGDGGLPGASGYAGRWVENTDPMGFHDRLEFTPQPTTVPYAEAASTVPTGMTFSTNDNLNNRNTYFWDKHVYSLYPGDYLKSRIIHWSHFKYITSQIMGTPESIKNPLENRVRYDYSGQTLLRVSGDNTHPANVARVLDSGATQITKTLYNQYNKPTQVTDPTGRVTHYDYDPANNIDLLTIRQKDSASTTATIATFTYNAQHKPLTYTDAAGDTTTYTYNGAGQLATVTNANSETTTYTYDGTNRLSTITNPASVVVLTLTYDSNDRVLTRTDQQGHTLTYTYDNFDRVTRITYPDTTYIDYTYTNLDLTSVRDRQARVTTYTYDANRRLTKITDPLLRETKFTYYNNGLLKTLEDPNTNVTSWDIDIQGRVTKKTYPDGKFDTIAYENTTSRVKSVTDALGQVKTLAYNLDDSASAVTYTASLQPTPNVSFTYDTWFPRMTTMVDGNGTTTYSYVPVGTNGALSLAGEDGPFANDAIALTYDDLGRVDTRSVGGSSETFTYDTRGRLSTHATGLGTFTTTYLGETAQPVLQQLPAGLVSTAWGYDTNTNDRRLATITHSGSNRNGTYTSIAGGRITNLAESSAVSGTWPARTWTYGYDNAERLSTASFPSNSFSYTLDPADNPTNITTPAGGSVNATFNILNQNNSFTHDFNGNITTDGVRNYTWDAENRLINITYVGVSGKNTALTYDGLSRLVQLIETPPGGGGTTTIRYTWCGEEICQQRDGSNTITKRYYAEGESIIGGANYAYQRDHLGSVRNMMDASTGNRVTSYDYDPYGNTLQSNGTPESTFKYAGMLSHAASGLYITHYRAYDPKTARWLNRDPIGENGGINLYGYVGGRPILYRDPLGLQAVPFPMTPIPGMGIPGMTPTPGDNEALADMLGKQCQNNLAMYSLIYKAMTGMIHPRDTANDNVTAERCEKEWEDAGKYCEDLYKGGYIPPANGKGIGGKNIGQCIAGQVSEACGGNPVE